MNSRSTPPGRSGPPSSPPPPFAAGPPRRPSTAPPPASPPSASPSSLAPPSSSLHPTAPPSTAPRSAAPGPGGSYPPPPRTDQVTWKGLATALDGLVQTNRTSPAALELIAKRAVQQWAELGCAPLEIKGTELLAGTQVVLSHEQGQGPWLLPAFMAGVRTIRPTPTCQPSDLRSFADELATLRPEVESLSNFRDWLWSDGAEGFEVELHVSFMEVMDAAHTDDTHRDALRAFRGESMTAFGPDSRVIASRELDVAAAREEFNVPLQLFSREVARDSLRLDPEDALALAEECEGSYGWTHIEIALTLAHPEMRGAIAPQRLARLITQQLGESLDDRALDLLASLGSRDDPYVRALAEALDDPALGESLAARASPTARSALALRRFFRVCSPKVARGMAVGLVERATAHPEVLPWVLGVAIDVGLSTFVQLLTLGGVRDEVAPTVIDVMLGAGATSDLLTELLTALPPRVAATMLVRLPRDQFQRVSDFVAKLMATAEPDAVNLLVPALLQQGSPEAAALVGDCLLRTMAAGWSGRALQPACAYLLEHGLGRKYLLPLARSSKAEPRVRLLLLRSLSTHPELLEESCRWGFGELLEPPEVRARLQDMRKQLKASREGGHGPVSS